MGFGGGVLIAVVSVELMTEAYSGGEPVSAVIGLLAGGGVFSFINWRLSRLGAKNRNRCGECVAQPSETEREGSGLAIAVGAVLDGIPEALVIGLSLLGGGKLAAGVVAGFFLANIPQGLSSASGMKLAGRSRRYIFAVWIGIPVITAAAAATGALILGSVSAQAPAAILAFAAGAVLAMLAEASPPRPAKRRTTVCGARMHVGHR